MLRRLFTLASAVSLVMFIGAAALWVQPQAMFRSQPVMHPVFTIADYTLWNDPESLAITAPDLYTLSGSHVSVGLALMVLPVVWILATSYRSYRDRRSAKQGRCGICNYDLRATPDRCPECGTAVSPEATLRR